MGMKPERGGRPPRESIRRGARAVSVGAFVQEVANELILVEFCSLNRVKVEKVIIKYRARASKVREGENCMMRIIHPK